MRSSRTRDSLDVIEQMTLFVQFADDAGEERSSTKTLFYNFWIDEVLLMSREGCVLDERFRRRGFVWRRSARSDRSNAKRVGVGVFWWRRTQPVRPKNRV